MDIREHLDGDFTEVFRTVFAGMMKGVHTIMPARIVQDTTNGHVATAQPTIKAAITDPKTNQTTFVDHPVHVDVPIHHMGGGGVSQTFPNKKGDTGALLYAERSIDTWFQSDGTQQPIEDRSHNVADSFFLSGIRSVPRMLQQVEKDSAQHRTDDKKHADDLHPADGFKRKTVDPSTPAASTNYDPFRDATKFFESLVHPSNGVAHNATDGSTTHAYGLSHLLGHIMGVMNGLHTVNAHPQNGLSMLAQNGLHSVLAHPSNGASMNASNLLHSVLASPALGALLMSSQGGSHMMSVNGGGASVMSDKTVSITSGGPLSLNCPPGMLGLPSGGVNASSLATGAAAANVGPVGGDLSGDLPNPVVVGLSNVAGLDQWPGYPDDTTAGAAGVKIGGLYRNIGAVANFSLLAVRMS